MWAIPTNLLRPARSISRASFHQVSRGFLWSVGLTGFFRVFAGLCASLWLWILRLLKPKSSERLQFSVRAPRSESNAGLKGPSALNALKALYPKDALDGDKCRAAPCSDVGD